MSERDTTKNFVHLNVHSHYSKGWGMGTIEELCRSAKKQGMDRLALTDTNGVYGLVFFLQIAKEVGIQTIVGSELATEDHRAVLLAKNHEGYANLCRIISDRHCHQGFDLILSLKARRQGLIILSDDFRLLKALKRESKEDLFVEMSPGYNMHKCYAFSRDSKIPPLATNRVYLITKEQFRLHQLLRAVALNTKLSRLTYSDTCRPHNILNSPQDMMDQFPHVPHAVLNTLEVANACLSDWNLSQIIFPHFERMTDEEAYQRLYRATMDGCRRRYGTITRVVRNRVEHEMKIIKEKNFAHYFLVVADMTKRAVRSCGRGSAAASIVSYALEITHVDPIKHNLFFERFLNLGRMDPPDIDIDFAWDERDQIMDYVFAKYGNRRAAMVANHNTFGARSAIREVAKVFGLTEAEINHVTRRIGFGWRLRQVWRDLKNHPKMRDIEFKKPWDEILRTAAQLEDHLNHLSVHCGGLVVVPDEIRRYCPVEISANGVQVLQWEKDSVEDSGLVKIDILGNRSLAVIRDALALVEQNSGLRIDYATWNPIDDPKTVEIFYRGDTFGVFYFESPATRQTLVKVGSGFTLEEYLQEDHFHLNVVVTSIIRPASNPSIRTWVSRLHGQAWNPPHPLLRPVLEETLGVMVFQEQLSQAAIHLAGFDPAEADTLRKVVSKKHKEKKLRDFQTHFEQGARRRGVSRKTIEEVWQMMMGFDGYSFCKPHSASYTLVAYKSAFLRAHYPAEFMASVISNGGGYYSPLGYLSEAKRMGLKILPPDINQSEIKYTGREKEIRVGFMQLKDLAQEAKEAIIHERSKHGPFISLADFMERTESHLHLQDIRVLIKAGCFDRIAHSIPRPGLVWQALQFFDTPTLPSPLSLPFPDKIATQFCTTPLIQEGSQRQSRVIHTEPRSSMYPAQLSKIPTLRRGKGRGRGNGNYSRKYVPAPYPKNTMLKHEIETFGFLLSIHPIDRYNHMLKGLDYVKARDLQAWVGKRVSTVGWMVTGKTVRTKDGDSMKFVSFEDPTGIYEAVFFPKVYHRYCNMLNGSRAYIIKGKVEEDFRAINIQVNWIGFLDKFKSGFSVDTRKEISHTSTQMG
jgi:error-prone DNA polymerase